MLTIIAGLALIVQSTTATTYKRLPQQVPSIVVNPTVINSSLACSDSTFVPLTITNSGTTPLTFDLNVFGNGNGNDTAVLVIQETASWSLLMNSFLIQEFGITPTVITSQQIATANFSLYDIIVTVGGQSANYYNNLTANLPKFTNFVTAGGILISQGALYSGYSSTIPGGVVQNYGSQESSNNAALLTHPILNGVITPITGNSASHGALSNLPVGAQIITTQATNGLPTTAEYDLGLGKVIATTMPWEYSHQNAQYTSKPLLLNAWKYAVDLLNGFSSWIQVSNTAGTIPAGGSTTIQVKINASGLNAGNYAGNINVSSNDPANPSIDVPVNLSVIGNPVISLSANCATFGTVTQFTTHTDTIAISNTGCDTLKVTSATPSIAGYTIAGLPMNIPPGGSQNLIVTFSPTTVGNFNSNLALVNNASSTNICLIGSAGAAPDIAVNPSVINYTLNCSDSALVPIYISNVGGSDLNYNFNNSGGSGAGVRKILAMTQGVDLTGEYANTINSINTYFTNYQVTQLNTTSAIALQSALIGTNILLFPETESGLNNYYVGIAPVVQNFINSGGTVIVCGDVYASNRIYDLGLFTGNFVNYTNTGSGVISDTTNYLVDGINQFTVPLTNSSAYHNITNTDKVEVVSYLGNDLVTYRNVGLGRAIYIGWDYFAFNASTQRIIANAVKGGGTSWLILDSIAGVIPAGGTDTVLIELNSTNLPLGNHTANVVINSNDPTNPVQNILVNLTVAGPPQMTLSNNCLNFGTITQFSSKSDTLTIGNEGCDTLHVTSANPSLAQYLSTGLPLHIPPGGNANLIVTFNPTSIGNFNGSLLLVNNDVNTSVCLIGSAGAAPQIATNPPAINYTINCSDSAQVPLIVYNTGGSDLNFNISGGASGGGAGSPIQVLSFMDGVDASTEYPNMIAGINQYFTNYVNTQFFGTTASALQAALVGKSVLLFPEKESGIATYYSLLAPVVQNFMNSGGTVIMCGTDFAENNIYDLGLFSGTYGGYTPTTTLSIIDTTNYLVNGINQLTMPSVSATFYHTFTNPDRTKVVLYGTAEVVSYRQVGLGKAIFVGFDFYNTNTSTNRIIANAIKGGGSTWLGYNPTSGLVSPGDSTTIMVSLNALSLNGGVYNSTLTLSSNDPVNPQFNVPITLNVIGSSNINLSASCLDFGQIQQFTSLKDTLIISNSGCDSLHVSSLFTNNPQFTVTPSNMVIASGNSAPVIVTYTPSSIGTTNANLIIQNNDQDSIVCLIGQAFAAPQIDLPAIINVNATSCADSVVTSFYVQNSGGGNLNWNAGGGNGNVRVLAMTFGADLVEEYANTILSINQYFTDYTLTTSNTTSASVLQTLLQNVDVLLFPEQENSSATHYTALAPVVQNFVNNGGTVILCGSLFTQNRPFELGLFTGTYGSSSNAGTAIINITNDYLVAGIVGNTFTNANATISYNFTNADKIEVVSFNSEDVVTYRNIGAGRAIFIGFDYYAYYTQNQRIIANAVGSANVNNNPSWIEIIPSNGNVAGGDSTLVYMVVHTDSLSGGTYNQYYTIASNDPLQPLDSILVSVNVSNLPCPNFDFTVASLCDANVNFVDQTNNNPISWQWDFGDGSFSSIENPSHTYTTNGNFQVKLVVCNAFGCDSITQTVNIFSLTGPIAANCNPITTSYCCGMGIAEVTLNTINNISTNASAGYQNFSCTQSTTLIAGNSYTLTVKTATTVYNENVRAWIDYNNNGVFEVLSEQVLATNNVNLTHTATFIIPGTAVTNVPLRLRIADDYYINPAPQPCNNVLNGQFEDYSVIILPNTAPPSANFTFNITDPCDYIVQFNDQSLNALSLSWDFGDGFTSTVQNPSHQYANSGVYVVWQYVTNAYGIDSTSNFVTINSFNPSLSYTGTLLEGNSISFTCIPSGGSSFIWNFGDGFQSTIQNPQHIYQNMGTYYLTLNISNGPCSVTLYDTLIINGITAIKEQALPVSLVAFPNPFSDNIQINYNLNETSQVSLKVLDVVGREVEIFENNILQPKGKYLHHFTTEAAGIYFIQLAVNGKRITHKIVKVN